MRLDEACSAVVDWAGGRLVDSGEAGGLVVGGEPQNDLISIAGTDWMSEVDTHPSHMGGDHPFGSIAAACLGTARAFHQALHKEIGLMPPPRHPLRLSLIDYRAGRSTVDVRPITTPVTLVGAGAVGQAVAWSAVLGNVDFEGGFDIVDPQTLDMSNLNRHLVSGRIDIGKLKAEIATTFMMPVAPQAQSWPITFTDYRSDREMIRTTAISTVDNNNARYQIQGAFPRSVLHGATSQEIISAAVLDPLHGACLGCLFPQQQQSPAAEISQLTGIPEPLVAEALAQNGVISEEMLPPLAERLGVPTPDLAALIGRDFREAYAREICGRLGGFAAAPTIAPTVAYVSALAGCFLISELVKLSSFGSGAPFLNNYLQMAVLHPETPWLGFRDKDPDCPLMCSSSALQDFIRSRWTTSASN
jgi:molybdopterin/thiamine biosynthesis adenylyltransferase